MDPMEVIDPKSHKNISFVVIDGDIIFRLKNFTQEEMQIINNLNIDTSVYALNLDIITD